MGDVQAIGGIAGGGDGGQVDAALQAAPFIVERGGIHGEGGNDGDEPHRAGEQYGKIAALIAGEPAPQAHMPPRRITEV